MQIKTLLKSSLVQAMQTTERLVRPQPAYSPAVLSSFRNFLFLQYGMPLGYCVHDTPIYEAMRVCMPDAKIAVATLGPGFETLRHNPFVDQIITTADPLVDTFRAVKQLRVAPRNNFKPQCCITSNAEPNWRLRVTSLNMLSGPHVRLGGTLTPRLYHLPQKYDPSVSLIDNNLCLLANFACPVEHVEPRVFFMEKDAEAVRALLQARGISLEKPLAVFVTQNSGGQLTGWHPERFAQVIRHVSQKCQIIFVGTAKDDEPIKALRTLAGPLGASASASLAGLTTIPELSALLCLADYAISLDTGTMHVGRAAGVPMVVLGPSWQKPLQWLPLGLKRVRILRGDDIDHVPANYHLDEIHVGPVIAAFEELFLLYPPSDLERSARLRKSHSTVDHGRG